jgi:hypothetical protein
VALDRVVLEADVEGRLVRAVHLFRVINDGDRTYIGEMEGAIGQPTVQFLLPIDAKELQVSGGSAPQDFIGWDTGFADTAPLVPGEKEILATYAIPYGEADLLFRRTILNPTGKLEILVRGGLPVLNGPTLSGPVATEIEGVTYLLVEAHSLPADALIELRLSDLPLSEPGREVPDLLFPLIGAGIATVAIAVLYLRIRRRSARTAI